MKKQIAIISAVLMISILGLFSLPQSVFATNPPTSGLQLWWKMDEGTGTTVTDSSPNGYTGTLTNGPTWTTGPFAGTSGISFTFGSSQYITTVSNPANLNINTGTAVSVCAWFNTNSHAPSDWENIAEKGDNDAGSYGIYHGSDTNLLWQPNNVGGMTTTTTITGSNWHHICAIYAGTGTGALYVYIDNVKDATTADGTAAVGSNTGPFKVGKSGSYYLTGIVSEVLVYNRALTSTEIGDIYNYVPATTTTTTISTTTSITNTTTTSSTYTAYNHTATIFTTNTSLTTTSTTIHTTQISTNTTSTSTNKTNTLWAYSTLVKQGVIVNDTSGAQLAANFLLITGVLVVAIVVIAFVINRRNHGGL